MEEGARPHLVILVHGIRDIARWQGDVGRALESEGLLVEHTSYGRWNLVLFLLPFDFIRRIAMARVWTDIQQARMLHPGADVSIIAHSFGTFVVTRILKEQFTLQLTRLILCGSVVRYDFPFEQIQNRFVPPLINDVGTSDPWPATAESLTTGYGSAGTFGFNRPGVRDRYHNGKSHGYFLTEAFARKYWAPFLKDGSVVPGDENADLPPLFVRLLQVVKVKYLIALALIVLLVFALLRGIYGSPALALQFGDSGFGFWNGTVAPMLDVAAEPCPLPRVVCDSLAGPMITGRRYVAADITGGDPAAVVSCGRFRYPAVGDGHDPVAAIEAVAAAFPQCVAVSATGNWLGFALKPEGMTAVQPSRQSLPRRMFLCGCSAAEIEEFKSRY